LEGYSLIELRPLGLKGRLDVLSGTAACPTQRRAPYRRLPAVHTVHRVHSVHNGYPRTLAANANPALAPKKLLGTGHPWPFAQPTLTQAE